MDDAGLADAGRDRALDAVAAALRVARGVVVVTGAGVSAESGIRTFRDTMEGLWKEFDPAKLATPEAFEADPETVTRWYDWRRRGCLAAEPNAGHIALAEMERMVVARGGRFTLLTQNVDRLHQKAGSRNVVELHGSIIEWRCTRTGRKVMPPEEGFGEFPPRSPYGKEGQWGMGSGQWDEGNPSPCPPGTLPQRERGETQRDAAGSRSKRARALLRPDVVWFGEMLPEAALAAADEAMETCDLFFSVGTSSVVYPAAGYVVMAKRRGAVTVEVNKDATAASGVVDFALRGPSGTLLPQILTAASH